MDFRLDGTRSPSSVQTFTQLSFTSESILPNGRGFDGAIGGGKLLLQSRFFYVGLLLSLPCFLLNYLGVISLLSLWFFFSLT